jgi:Protein of unknown function (DUF3108)
MTALAAGCLWVASVSSLGAAGTGQHVRRDQTGALKSELDPAKAAMPFRVGEVLNYRVSWATFTSAASLRLSVPEQRDLFGQYTWHFRAALHTVSPVQNLFAIDDQFDSYADATNLEGRQYEWYLDEMGKRQDRVLHFVPVGESSRAPDPHVIVLPGTRDPVGLLYALRRVDWRQTQEFRSPVYDGHEMYEVSVRREAPNDAVTVAAGRFSASRLSVRLAQHGKEVSDIGLEIWLANGAARTPVEFQARLPFGSVQAELISAADGLAQ